MRLTDRAGAARRFRRIWGCLEDDEFPEPRDRELAVLLAWSGVLASRLSRGERRIAARALRKLVRSTGLGDSWQAPLTGQAPEPGWVSALGRVAYEAQGDVLHEAATDLFSAGSGFDAVSLGGVDAGSGGGSEGGGSDGR